MGENSLLHKGIEPARLGTCLCSTSIAVTVHGNKAKIVKNQLRQEIRFSRKH